MNDLQIRTALKKKILSRLSGKTKPLIIDEFGLKHGLARIDIIVINHILHGFEIKSNKDTLIRLPEQVRIYNTALDRITLVVGYSQAYEALNIIPEWWGVKLFTVGPRGAIHFSDARSPKNNPSQDKVALCELLWKTEALSLLDEIDSTKGYKTKPRSAIYKRIVDVSNIEMLQVKVREQLRKRFDLQYFLQQQ